MTENVVERRIMWGDLDALGIVFYPRFHEWIDASGHLFFEAAGVPMDELWRTRGLLFGLAETGCRYQRPGRYFDRIRIATRLAELGEKTLTLDHTIRRADDGEVLVEGFEKRVCMDVSDPGRFRAVALPAEVRAALSRTLAG